MIPLPFFQMLVYVALAHDFKKAGNLGSPRTLELESEGAHFTSSTSA